MSKKTKKTYHCGEENDRILWGRLVVGVGLIIGGCVIGVWSVASLTKLWLAY